MGGASDPLRQLLRHYEALHRDQYSDDLLHGGRVRLAASARAPSRSTGSPCVTSTRSTSSCVSSSSIGRKRCSYQIRRRSPSRCLGHTRSSPSTTSTVSPKARARCDGSSNG